MTSNKIQTGSILEEHQHRRPKPRALQPVGTDAWRQYLVGCDPEYRVDTQAEEDRRRGVLRDFTGGHGSGRVGHDVDAAARPAADRGRALAVMKSAKFERLDETQKGEYADAANQLMKDMSWEQRRAVPE